MLGLAKRLKVKIFQASTSEIYGDPSVHPQPESYWGNVNTLGPRACSFRISSCRPCRTFCYVDELINGFRKLMDTSDEVTGPVNLGNPGEFTMVQLAETIIELTGSRSSLVREPLPMDDPGQRQPNITRAKDLLGWVPTIADSDARKIAARDDGIMPIYEPGLKELVERNLRDRLLAFTTDLATALAGVEVAFIAVGNPSRREGRLG